MMFLFSLTSIAIADTPIEKVVVYTDRAQVSRKGTSSCAKGTASIRFSSLPKLIKVNTLRATTSQKNEVIGIEIEKERRSNPLNEEFAKIEDDIVSKKQDIIPLRTKMDILNNREQKVVSYRSYLSAQIKSSTIDSPNTKQWGENLDFISNEELSIYKEKQLLNKKIYEMEEQIALLRDQGRRLGFNPQREVFNATVLVRCTTSSVPATLSYVVPQASWEPEYDLQYTQKDGTAQIRTAVTIRQSTGEDWNNTKLILSTAQPQLGSRAPYPQTIIVNGRKDTEPKQLLSKAEDQQQLSSGGGFVQSSRVRVEQQGTMLELEVPKKVDIVSNGHPYWVPLDEHSAKAKQTWVTIPKISPYVYQTISFFNPSPYPILKGKIQVQRNGTFMGHHPLPYTATGEPIEVSLGSDTRYRVEYEPIVLKKKNKGMFDFNKYLDRAFRITITNLTDQKQSIEVRDQIPVSKHEKINVEMGEKTTAGYTIDNKQGLLSWDLELEASQTKVLELYYKIQIPDEWR
ncbi:MAG: hypothetical protein CL916_00560 [Deltaproteobacteria bacterium]|nr:hypothetical protein [Deltaproteobacteria bacterium]